MEPLPQLGWRHDLFADHIVHMDKMVAFKPRVKAEDACICGKPHRQNVSYTKRSPIGTGFSVRYFCCNNCKSKAIRAENK